MWWIVLSTSLLSVALLAADALPTQVRLLERLSLVLTGKLPSEQMKNDLVRGERNLLEIADELKDSEDFERQLAYFYQEKLNITTPVNVTDIYTYVFSTERQRLSKELVRIENQDSMDEKYQRRVAAAITVEPGRIMAKNVREERNYAEILTTSKGVVNGHYLHFLQNFGNVIHTSFFKNGDQHVEKANVLNSYPELNSMQIDIDDNNFYWIERGSNKHAGVLTTIAFHRATNGRRAKANLARSALLCREFVDPTGAVPKPMDRRRLEERAYCGGCHKYLEPMAAFFYRWPDTGNDNNYFYNHVQKSRTTYYIDTTCGEDCRAEGDGVRALADILVSYKDQSFKKCAIKHAYEFIVRQQLRGNIVRESMPNFLKIYEDSGGKIWAVMRKIIDSDFFRSSADDAL